MVYYAKILVLLFFKNDNIGPSYVVTEFVKHVKTKGAMKGNLIWPAICYCSFYKFTLYNFDYTN
jgi:hypothetical protein